MQKLNADGKAPRYAIQDLVFDRSHLYSFRPGTSDQANYIHYFDHLVCNLLNKIDGIRVVTMYATEYLES